MNTIRIFAGFRMGLALSVLLSGAIAAFGAKATGPLRLCAANPRYFADASGHPVYLTGSHTWANFATDQGTTEFDYAGYLDFLVAHHHNFFRGWMWDVPHSVQGFNGGPFDWQPMPWQRTGPGLATDGKPRFDLTKWDQRYFDRIRARVIAARQRGIYVSIMLFQGFAWQFNRSDADGFPYDGRNNVNGVGAGPKDAAATLDNPAVMAAQEAYVRKVIDTLNDLGNVLYEISNESGPDSTPWQYHMIDFIHRYERTKSVQHPVGMTYQYNGGSNTDLYASSADWISPNCEEELIKAPPPADGNKVIIFDTDHGYGWQLLKRDGPALHRAWVWKNFCRGNQTLFMDPYLAKTSGGATGRNHPGGTDPRDPYFGLTPDPYWEPLRISMGYARRYAQKVGLDAMTPHGELSSTGYCLAHPGEEYVVYQPEAGRIFTVQLGRGPFNFEWFDPVTGKIAASGRLETGADGTHFVAPWAGDAVLYLKKAR